MFLTPALCRNAFLAITLIFGLMSATAVRGAVSGHPPGPRVAEEVDLRPYAQVFYVDVARGDDFRGDGSTLRPFASLPRAMEAISRPSADARVAVLVAQGRFALPTWALTPHVDLYGGFESAGGRRDVLAFPTIFDGLESNRIIIAADSARLDGFHLVNGRVRGKGAAILCDGTSPVFRNCVFTGNRTTPPVPWNPLFLHETGNDGGAIMVLRGGAPVVEHCLFYDNQTECGRGGAVAVDYHSNPVVRHNVFANNRAGLHDAMRSSDGGAVSWFRGSGGEFRGNIVVGNEALAKNDAGGLFVALWSSPLIADNVIVGNSAEDDAGGLFIGGQEHRYDRPFDEYPSAEDFHVFVTGNVLVGNSNSTRNSGAMRVTMESRATFRHNLVTENTGGFYLQRSEIVAEQNTVWQDWRFVEDKATLGPSVFRGNILAGPMAAVEARLRFERNMAEAGVPGGPHLPVEDLYLEDGLTGALAKLTFDSRTFTTRLKTREPLPAGSNLVGRPIRLGDGQRGGQWRVVASAAGDEITVWGRLDSVTKAPGFFQVLRTFTPRPDSPAGLGRVPSP
jgi:hypothetical protein